MVKPKAAVIFLSRFNHAHVACLHAAKSSSSMEDGKGTPVSYNADVVGKLLLAILLYFVITLQWFVNFFWLQCCIL